MSRVGEKGKRLEFLIGRVDEAIAAGFFVEAISLTYSLMEERTYSLLTQLHIPYGSGDKIYHCLKKLSNRINDCTVTVSPHKISTDGFNDWLKAELVDSRLIEDIQTWREKRNDITHDLAKLNIDYSSIGNYAVDGSAYLRKYAAIIMRLKKML